MNSTFCRDFESQLVPTGSFFKSDRCKMCLCSNGSSIFCTTKFCPPEACVTPTQKADECCKLDCLSSNSSRPTQIKVISIETDPVKQGARFGATALTISIIVSLFIFMLMRLKRRQALLNSLSHRSSLAQQNLLSDSTGDSNLDGLLQLRRILRRGREASQRSYPSTSDFIHFMPTSSPCTMVGRIHHSARPNLLDRGSPRSIDFLASNPDSEFFGLTPPSYEALPEKIEEDWPPPYEAPPPYSETPERAMTSTEASGGNALCSNPEPITETPQIQREDEV